LNVDTFFDSNSHNNRTCSNVTNYPAEHNNKMWYGLAGYLVHSILTTHRICFGGYVNENYNKNIMYSSVYGKFS
jgi:hypothetical protein